MKLFLFLLSSFTLWVTILMAAPTPDIAPDIPPPSLVSPKSTLKGVVVMVMPYVMPTTEGNNYTGFLPDLLAEISRKGNFTYQLNAEPEGRYGVVHDNGTIIGMIGQVYRKEVDFALADLTITDLRKKYVQFTEPYLQVELVALIRKEDVKGFNTLEQLAEYNQRVHASGGEPSKAIKYGVVRNGATQYYLSHSNDTTAKAIYNSINANITHSLVPSLRGALNLVKQGQFAMLVESPTAEYLASQNCDLAIVRSVGLFTRQYGIALQKDSPYLNMFNTAITELKTNGTIERLRSKYWHKPCPRGTVDNNNKQQEQQT